MGSSKECCLLDYYYYYYYYYYCNDYKHNSLCTIVPPIISLTTNPMDTNPANTNGPITVTCLATSHPIVESISLMSGQSSVGVTTIESIEQPDNSYEARVVYTINNGCPTQQFVCIVDNGPYKTTSEQITICQKGN